MEVTITEYLDTPINRPRAAGQLVTVPFSRLLDHLLSRVTDHRSKGAAGYWVAAPVPGPRSNAAAQPTRVVALDWDDSPDGPEWGVMAGLAYVGHTTDRHAPGAERWRVWVLLDREYTAAEVSRAVCPWPGAYLRAISQPAYIPTMGDDIEYTETFGGGPIVLSAWIPVEPPTPQPAPAGPRRDPSVAARNALVCRWLSNPDGTNRLAGALGATLADWGWSDADVAAWMAAWLHADPKLAKHTDDALRGAAKRRAGDRIVGFPVLDTELGVGVWAPERAELDITAVILAARSDAPAPVCGEPPFYLRSARDIRTKELPDIQWVCEALSLAPGAPGLCTGYSGVGKTTALQDLALAVATPGRRWLNCYPVRHGRVAHVDLEQGEQQTYRTYRALGLDETTPDDALACSVLPQWQLTDPENLAALTRLAVGRTLIIIDSFRAACLSGDENASEFAAPLANLSKISEATGCTFMLNHHSGKNNSDRMRSARGTSAITAACSVHWSFEREDLDPVTRPCLQLIKSRNHATEAMVWETYVEKVGTADSFQLHARANAGAEEPTRDDAAERIESLVVLELTNAGPDGLSFNQLADRINMNRNKLSATVRDMVQNKTLLRSKTGLRLGGIGT